MARYEVYVSCNVCSGVHSMRLVMTLKEGPADKQSIGGAYAGKPIPPELANLHRNFVLCSKTGNTFVQKDHEKIYF